MNKDLLERRYRLLGKDAPLFYDEPLHIVRGEGVFLYDAQGNAYLDAYNNVPVVGHCHPGVVQAISRQAATLNVHTRYLHEQILDYAQRLTASFDASLDMAIFTCTGSEANDVALRMARLLTGHQGIICSDATYHGNSAAVDELSTMFRQGQSTSPHVHPVPFPQTYRSLDGAQGQALEDAYVARVEAAIDALQKSGAGVAGMLVCPLFANEGLPDVPPDYLKRAAQRVRAAGGLVIFDEVQSGFGRTGHMWGQQQVGVVPDIVTLGKPMGNGHPIGGVISRAELVNAFRRKVMYFNTFGGNPVACAAGMAVLTAIEEEDLLARVRQVGSFMEAGLRALMDKHALVGDVRVRGTFMAVELVSDRAARTPDAAAARSVVNLMRQRGVLISRLGPFDNVLKMRPPLPFTQAHGEQLLRVLDGCLAEVGNV